MSHRMRLASKSVCLQSTLDRLLNVAAETNSIKLHRTFVCDTSDLQQVCHFMVSSMPLIVTEIVIKCQHIYCVKFIMLC
jgi:hypothetical protein